MTRPSILTTRPLAHSDFAAWFSLWTRYLHQSGRCMPWTDRATLFRTLTHSASGATAIVVECAGKMVGFAHCHTDCSDFEPTCQVKDLYVVPVFQAMHAGGRLMQAVYHAAAEAKVAIVHWTPSKQALRRRDTSSATSPAKRAA